MATINHSGILTNFSTLKDGTLKFTINCQEMPSEKAASIISLSNQYVKFLITDENIDDIKIKEIIDDRVIAVNNKKSPSQRLRSVLYIYWEKSDTDLSFNDFYKTQIERIINFFKTKLED